ncbi:MAG: vitamin B12-dependent ribonucleotide reductase [Dehalococcoidia bacterium]|nr:vitamin B12-dependent ribonucleotide reductase [Dehalococcoidia bacterium]
MSLEENTKVKKIEPTFPGMEHLVAASPHKMPAKEKIESIVTELLAEKISMEVPPENTSSLRPTRSKRVENVKADQVSELRVSDDTASSNHLPIDLTLTENALLVLQKRYLQKDEKGNVTETPEEMFRRVSKHIAAAELIFDKNAKVEEWEDKFFRLMVSLEFLPNSPTLMNAGRELGQLSACFVLPVEDSTESIFDAVKYTALIHKSGGGTGFSFSRIRPKQDRVGSTGGVASGPVSFMRAFDCATDVIKQGGMRRGANMGILSIDHPDILEFITCKDDPKAFTNFNISVAVTDAFMNAVENGSDYDLINPHNGEIVGHLNAGEVFNKIVDMAWRTGDPGVIFIDRINQYNTTPNLGKIECTNPCGEQPLLPYESCNLGSINLSKMTKTVNGKIEIDFDKLRDTVRLSARFLDDVIEVNKYPLQQINDMTRQTRKIGLGVMGFADMLIQLRVPYNSDRALEIAEKVMSFISYEAAAESASLAQARGVFPAFGGSVYSSQKGPDLRNANRTTIAPTGTLSIIAGCSSGIEPVFALSYFRHILDGEKLIEVNPFFKSTANQEKFYSTDLLKKLADGEKLVNIEDIPAWVKNVFVTSHDISPEWHVKIQAAFQKSTDSAVSKTVNLPHEATVDDVKQVYELAYQSGLKGITIYRDRSRDTQVLNTGKEKSNEKTKEIDVEARLAPRQRPKITRGITERVTTGCGYIYVTVNFDEKGICEVFSSLGKAGGCASAQLEATSRLISLIFRSGIDVGSVIKQLRAIRCPSVSWENGRAILSCADAIGSVLEKYVKKEDDNLVPAEHSYSANSGFSGQCPDCGNLLVYQEGCHICPSCGYTKCG